MHPKFIKNNCFLLLFLYSITLQAQSNQFLIPSDTLNKKRFWLTAGTGAAIYTGAVIGLSQVWYAESPQSGFHFFNDAGEWEHLDKTGHLYSTYFESKWSFQGARWIGIPHRKAAWLGAGLGMFYQLTIEIMDGFSEEWGFSTYDIGFNTLGALTFLGQELAWQEQRITLKYSAIPKSYPDYQVTSVDGTTTMPLSIRAEEIYGKSYAARLIKDYNIQTHWASANIASFIPNDTHRFPKWLNVAVGYGAENMYGGFENQWTYEGKDYVLDANLYPRHRQFFISPDIDFTKIETDRPFLKTLFFFLNMVKVPAPAVEFNSLGKTKWHWLR